MPIDRRSQSAMSRLRSRGAAGRHSDRHSRRRRGPRGVDRPASRAAIDPADGHQRQVGPGRRSRALSCGSRRRHETRGVQSSPQGAASRPSNGHRARAGRGAIRKGVGRPPAHSERAGTLGTDRARRYRLGPRAGRDSPCRSADDRADSTVLAALAQVLFLRGDVSGAVDSQQRAVRLSERPLRAALQKELDQYLRAGVPARDRL